MEIGGGLAGEADLVGGGAEERGDFFGDGLGEGEPRRRGFGPAVDAERAPLGDDAGEVRFGAAREETERVAVEVDFSGGQKKFRAETGEGISAVEFCGVGGHRRGGSRKECGQRKGEIRRGEPGGKFDRRVLRKVGLRCLLWCMKSPIVLRRLRVGVAVVGLAFTLEASACIQGYRLPSGKKTNMLVPILPLTDDVTAIKLETPKLEPFKIDGAIGGPMPGAAAKEEPEAAQFARYVRDFEARPTGAVASFEDTTDYAVALIHLGRSLDAIKVLVALEAKRPGVYTTAANLGTAYELTGDLAAAVKWISAGIERKAASHDGTEWLHVAILRAKIALRADAAWLAKHSVLDLAEAREAPEIVRAIEYQLGERLHFVKPTDAVVCDLFYQAALRVSGEQAPERRAAFLRESRRFGDWRKTEAEALEKS